MCHVPLRSIGYASRTPVAADEHHASDHDSAQHHKLGFPSMSPSYEEAYSRSKSSSPSSFMDDDNSQIGSDFDIGPGYQINDMDVICGRGKKSLNNQGNIHFRQIAFERARAYSALKTRAHKKEYVANIIAKVRSSGGHFLQKSRHDGGWYDIGDMAAAAKVGHALRDAMKGSVSPKASSSPTTTKKKANSHQVHQQSVVKNSELWGQLLGSGILREERSFHDPINLDVRAALESAIYEVGKQNDIQNLSDCREKLQEGSVLCEERNFHPVDCDVTTLESLLWITDGLMDNLE